jgi:predicted dehydrogenase
MKKKYKTIIIGFGNIAYNDDESNYKKWVVTTHYKNILNSKSFYLSAICDKKIIKNSKIKKEIKVYKNYKSILCNEKADLVIISTPDNMHYKILAEAAKYSPKMVFCEKPLCQNFNQVKKITNLYKKKKILLQVNYSRRFIPEFKKIKEDLKNNILGNIQIFQIFYSRGLMHNGSHAIDLVLWFFGLPKKIRVNKNVKSLSFIDDFCTTLTLYFKNNLVVQIIGIDVKNFGHLEINIIGSKKKYYINANNKLKIYELKKINSVKKYLFYKYRSKINIKTYKALPNALKNIEATYNKKENLLSPSDNSLNIFKVIMACKKKFKII